MGDMVHTEIQFIQMIDTGIHLEKFLQNSRFKKAIPYLKGDVLDFGGNEGELEKYVNGIYLAINYDHAMMYGKSFDTIVALAVIEHISVPNVYEVFRDFKKILKPEGRIFLTTPTPSSKIILKLMAKMGLLDKQNIDEHKHYWNRKDLMKLADETGFEIVFRKTFQFGCNQQALMKHK